MEEKIMTNEGILTKGIDLSQIGSISYSGGPLDSYDKMEEMVIKSLDGTDGLSFAICAVDRSSVPLCIQKIGNGNERECIFPNQDVLKFAVASSAYGLIIAHNSISAGVYYIEDDLDIIRYMQTKAMMLGIRLIDYIILDDHSTRKSLWFLSENLTVLTGYYGQMTAGQIERWR